ncbi:MAG: hypothetical protein WC124_02075 [Desulfoplanes sp.]
MDTKYILRGEGIIIVDRGAWLSGESYVAGDLCQDSGSYICTVGHLASVANEPGTEGGAAVWKALQVVTGTYESQYFKADDTIPYYRLIDGSDNDVSIRLNAGILEFYDNDGTALRASIDMSDGKITTPELAVNDKTDGQIIVPLQGGTAISGTWTISESSNVLILTHTAAVATHYYRMPIKIPSRTTALKGCKLKSVKVSYTIASADTTNDQLLFEIIKTTLPANGDGATAAVLAGDDDADYDTDHDTKAERLTAGSHTLTVTIPVGEQAYLAADEILAVRCTVTDAGTANLALVLTGAVALFDYQEN